MRKLIKNAHIVQASVPAAITSITPDYVSLKNYQHLTILVQVDVTSGTDSGAFALLQATAVAGTDAKALGFTKMWANLDTATEAFTETAVTSDTFLAGGVTKSTMYVVEIDADELDTENGFDCVSCSIADVTNGIGNITYILSQPRYIDDSAHKASITD